MAKPLGSWPLRAFIAAGLLLGLPHAAVAQAAPVAKPAPVLAALGISGVWAIACDQATGPRNPHIRYSAEPDGTVTLKVDGGADGISTTTLIAASTQPGNRLQTTSFTTFDNLPAPMRQVMERDHVRGDLTVRSTFSTETKGVLVPVDRFIKFSAEADEVQVVADGSAIDPATRQPGSKMPVINKCSD